MGSKQQSKPATFTYHINLDERGCFYADVRNTRGRTIYEIKIEGDQENDSTIFEDGFMCDKNDVDGLLDYMISLGRMRKGQMLEVEH